MIRPLLIVLAAGGGIAIVCGAAYAAIHKDRPSPTRDPAPAVTREIAWAGAERLDISTFSEVTYVQGKAPKITVTGKAGAVDHVTVKGGEIGFDTDCTRSHSSFKIAFFNSRYDRQTDTPRYSRKIETTKTDGGCVDTSGLSIEVVGTNTTRFDMSGGGSLRIRNYDQPKLDIGLSGFGKIDAAGKTGQVDLDLSGGGKADLSDLEVRDASVDLSGLGLARIKPSGKVRVDISGGGKVDLLSHPASLESHISGLGKISQP